MANLPKDFREFIELLNSHDVRYLIVGGYAVAYHGYPRATGDIDILIEPSEDNARRIESVLTTFGLGSLGLTFRDFLKSGIIVQLGFPPHRIDLATAITGVSFEEAWDGRIETELVGTPVKMISKANLLRNKAATGRPKDSADLDALS